MVRIVTTSYVIEEQVVRAVGSMMIIYTPEGVVSYPVDLNKVAFLPILCAPAKLTERSNKACFIDLIYVVALFLLATKSDSMFTCQT